MDGATGVLMHTHSNWLQSVVNALSYMQVKIAELQVANAKMIEFNKARLDHIDKLEAKIKAMNERLEQQESVQSWLA